MVVAVGDVDDVDDAAVRTIDADGLVVAPGFVDLHTHYDAQLAWDPAASPSPLHGVTTVIGGNCGFSLAPAGPDHAGYLARMMARVEGMPLAALERGLDWGWNGFGSWIDRLDGAVGVNAGFLVGHSTLRRAAMGDRSVGGHAEPADIEAMVALAHRSMEAGALGVSTSQANTHHDGEGQPVPSRWSERSELESLVAAVSSHPGTTVELIVAGCLNGFTDEEVELMGSLSLLAGRPVNWNVLGVSAANPGSVDAQLAASTAAARRGARVVALTLPHSMHVTLSFLTGAILDGFPGWREVLALPVPERIAALSDPATRRRLDAGAHSDEAGILSALANWEILRFDEVFDAANAACEGRSVRHVAAERGCDPFDALLDVVVADGLRTRLSPPMPESDADWELRARTWMDDRVVVGGSDAGAHLDVMCGAVYTTTLLAEAVRERELLSWEDAVRLLTDVPARLYGLRGRGRLRSGWFADVVVIDPVKVGPRAERTKSDLPGRASRLYAEADGIEHVLVNGTETVVHGKLTGTLPGTVLRSGRDTETVPIPGATAQRAGER